MMNSETDIAALAALGHPGRLAVFRLLARRAPDGVRPSDIAAALGMKANTLSVHVTTLARAGLVRSERQGKSVLYRIDLARAGRLIDFLVSDCCRGRPELCEPLAAHALSRLDRRHRAITGTRYNVLFICTGNSARSIFAEAILAREGAGRFRAFSAGTNPSAEVNPHTIEVLEQFGHDICGVRSKSLVEFQEPEAPQMDFVFTVCDRAANEDCPPWFGQPISAHWGVPSPAKAEGDMAEQSVAFLDTYQTIARRLAGFVELPIAGLDRISLQRRLDALAQEGAEIA